MLLRPALSLLLLLTPVTLAQLTPSQALAQAKSASKTQLATFKADTKTALATLDDALAVIETEISQEDHPSDIATDLGAALTAFTTSVENSWTTALELLDGAVSATIGELDEGGPDAGEYPAKLYAGSGGILDTHRKSVLKVAAKVRETAVKRLAKCASRIETSRGFTLNATLNLPAAALAFSVNLESLVQIDEGPRLNFVVALSDLGALEDGAIFVGGTSSDTANDVTISWLRKFGETDLEEVDVDQSTGHFEALFLQLVEGGYAVSVRQITGPVYDVTEIGVR